MLPALRLALLTWSPQSPFPAPTASDPGGAAAGGDGLVWADVDGDGLVDLLELNERGLVFLRDGESEFTDLTEAFGLGALAGPSGVRAVAVGDADGNGRPDLLLVARTGPARLALQDRAGASARRAGGADSSWGRSSLPDGSTGTATDARTSSSRGPAGATSTAT